MDKSINIGRIFGIQISINYSWFIVFGLVAWSLSSGYFPAFYPEKSVISYWAMGIVSSLLLFLSVLLHELSHTIVANKSGLRVNRISLFIFGGVAHLNEEPQNPYVELKVAIAGPICSVVLAGIFYLLESISKGVTKAIFEYVAFINLMLFGFNMIPGFPLDGGRILRALWWMNSGNLRRATEVSTSFGKGFAFLLIFYGFFLIISGNMISGMWLIFIGFFLYNAAEAGLKHTLIRRALSGIKVSDIMTRDIIHVEEDLTIDRLVEDYFLKYRYVFFPVLRGNEVVGVITIEDVRGIQKEFWPFKFIRDVMKPISADMIKSSKDEAVDVFEQMVAKNIGRFLVMENSQLIGIISRRDIMNLFKIKMDLGSD